MSLIAAEALKAAGRCTEGSSSHQGRARVIGFTCRRYFAAAESQCRALCTPCMLSVSDMTRHLDAHIRITICCAAYCLLHSKHPSLKCVLSSDAFSFAWGVPTSHAVTFVQML